MNASGTARRVLYVHFAPDRGGSATSLSLLVANLDRRRFTPFAVQAHPVMGPAVDQLKAAGATVDHVPVPLVWNQPWLSESNLRGRAWRAFRGQTAARDYLRRTAPDVVHVNDFPAVAFAVAAAEMNIPVVWHSRLVLAARRTGHPSARLLDTMNLRASRIVAISETEAEQFDREKVRVIYNPLDLDKIERARGTRAAMRRALKIDDAEFMVLAPVALTAAKGAWDFIPACGIAAATAPEVRFRFVMSGDIPGTGRRHEIRRKLGLKVESSFERAQREITNAGLSGRFELLGFRDDVYSLMDAADLVVFPSRLKACGRPCFEAAAIGRPVLVTMPGRNTRVVVEGETGRILPEADPATLGRTIADLARHPEVGRAMGEAARRRAPGLFGATAHATAVMELYDDVLAEASGSRGTEEWA